MVFSYDSHLQFCLLHSCDEGLKSSAFVTEYLKDPTAHTAPFNLALNTKSSMWEWLEEPKNDWRLRRFMAAMTNNDSRLKDTVFTEGKSLCVFDESKRSQDWIVKLQPSIGRR